MSKKSLFLSLLAILLFAGVLVGIIFLFKTHFMFVILGVLLFAFPVILRNKAMDAASGTLDKVIAKYIVPILAVVLTLFAILSMAFWIK